jgi:SAM-dependent methyltransferase
VRPAVTAKGLTPYDVIAYPSRAFPQTHPDRLATHAKMFGLPTAPIDRCRVLDIGAGEGANLMSLAVACPDARFVGFDLAGSAVRHGQDEIEALGLTNFRLFHGDILDVELPEAPFDYVICHGLYSWIPEPVRDGLMALIKRVLAPSGVAFVSYNAMPGCHLRQILREILTYQVRDVREPTARSDAARAYLDRLIDGYPDRGIFQELLKDEARMLRDRPMGAMEHDEMGEVFDPVYAHQFMDHAASHGLKFLTEAEMARAGEGFLPPHALDDPHFDIIAHVQEMDFRDNRYFRETLLVHDDVEFSRRPDPSKIFDLHVSTSAVRNDEGKFESNEAVFEVTDEKLAAAVETVARAWPCSLPVREVIEDEDRAAVLQRMYWVGTVSLHAAPLNYVVEAGERPEASALARLQAKSGKNRLTTLRHHLVDVSDPFSREFIAELDGRRTRAELARDVSVRLNASIDDVTPLLEKNLGVLARMPILVG